MKLAETVGNALVVVTAMLAWTFVVTYHVRARWWETETGRNVMAFMAVVAAVCTLAAIRIVAGAGLDTPWYAWLRVAVFAPVPVVIAWRILLLVRAQAEVRRRATTPTGDDGMRDGR